MQPLLVPQTTEFVICISIYIRLHTVTLLPTPRSLVPRLGLGNTWVRQLRSGSCHNPTAATKCNVSRLANKPRQWKSMLNHQGWLNLLIYATFTRTTNYRVCNLHIYLYPTPHRHNCTGEKDMDPFEWIRQDWTLSKKRLDTFNNYALIGYLVGEKALIKSPTLDKLTIFL